MRNKDNVRQHSSQSRGLLAQTPEAEAALAGNRGWRAIVSLRHARAHPRGHSAGRDGLKSAEEGR